MKKDLYRRVNNQCCIDDMISLLQTGKNQLINGSICEAGKTMHILGEDIFVCNERHCADTNMYLPCNGCDSSDFVHVEGYTLIDW